MATCGEARPSRIPARASNEASVCDYGMLERELMFSLGFYSFYARPKWGSRNCHSSPLPRVVVQILLVSPIKLTAGIGSLHDLP